MTYNINKEIHERAKKLGVTVKPSSDRTKKLDVYQNGKLICRIGQAGSNDYHLYKQSHGLVYANERRRLYYQRHPYNIKIKDNNYTPDYLAKALLW